MIFCQVSDFKKGEEFFSLALDNVDQQLEYKQFPVLANLLMISMHTKNDSLLQKVQKRCDEIPSEDLLEYRKSLRPGMLEYRTTESFSFFGFSGLSYIF